MTKFEKIRTFERYWHNAHSIGWEGCGTRELVAKMDKRYKEKLHLMEQARRAAEVGGTRDRSNRKWY